MRSTGKTEWEKYIHFICDNINHCKLAAIGNISPASVDDVTEYQVRKAQQTKPFLDWHKQVENAKSFSEKTPAQRKFNVRDCVYLSFKKTAMDKSYDLQRGTLYFITRILATQDPVRYELADLKGRPVPGSYYQEQLVKSPTKPDENKLWLIKPQETYKERTKDGKKQIYVQWLFYPAKDGEWIDKNSIEPAAKANNA